MSDLNGQQTFHRTNMTPAQAIAVQNVCKSQEDLQVVWDNPGVYKFGPKHNAYVTMCVVEETPGGDPEYKWTACVRLVNPVKRTFKPRSTWRIHEVIKAHTMLDHELKDVGDDGQTERFQSSTGEHLNKRLTPAEMGFMLRDKIVGNGHKVSPTIVNPREAKKLVDKLIKDFED